MQNLRASAVAAEEREDVAGFGLGVGLGALLTVPAAVLLVLGDLFVALLVGASHVPGVRGVHECVVRGCVVVRECVNA